MEVVKDYEITIFDELDLQREAANTSQLRRNFEDSDLLYVPEVYWDYTRNNVFVMERIHGVPISDRDQLLAEGVNLKELAERGVKIFFTQVFRDSFFHADMHPGNIFVSTRNPKEPQYIGIDCAIMGTLSDFDQYYLARNLLAIFKRDYRQVAELHIECGWVPRETRVGEFESAIRSACEPIFEKPLGEISFGQLLIYLFQTARRFNMEVQPSLVLLQKTLLHVEGLGREIYPELDLWNTAQPFLEQWVQDRYSPKGILERVQKFAPSWLEQIPQRPELILEGWQRAEQTSNAYQSQQRQLDELRESLRENTRRQRSGLWIGVAALLGIYWINSGSAVPPWQELHPASWALGAAALYMLAFRR
jgi:ubiquinone biosynthesis protein